MFAHSDLIFVFVEMLDLIYRLPNNLVFPNGFCSFMSLDWYRFHSLISLTLSFIFYFLFFFLFSVFIFGFEIEVFNILYFCITDCRWF